jgi:hypothetical protein
VLPCFAGFNDTVGPTISGLQLRTPATNTGIPQTTDPTITGKVLDNGGLNNIAYVEFDPTNSGFESSQHIPNIHVGRFG